MDIQSWAAAAGATAAVAGGFWALTKYGPGFIAKKVDEAFQGAKTSPWWRAKPHRVQFLRAAAVFLEAEIPDPGQGQEVYDAFGAAMAARARLGVIQIGSAAQWAKAARAFGDAVDTQLDKEVLDLAADAPPAP